MHPLPPARFDFGDAIARWPEPRDVASMTAAARANFERLTPWMNWAPTLEAVNEGAMGEFVAQCVQDREVGTSVNYTLRSPDDGECVGGLGLHDRIGGDALEIGYWLVEAASG